MADIVIYFLIRMLEFTVAAQWFLLTTKTHYDENYEYFVYKILSFLKWHFWKIIIFFTMFIYRHGIRFLNALNLYVLL